jgi:2-dehydro-3-deoxy-L-rhamnonate dehydrogenase (NAD+)
VCSNNGRLLRARLTINELDLEGRVAIVTGGARGIGYAVTERVLQSGGAVSLWDSDAQKLEEARAVLSVHREVSPHIVELTQDEARSRPQRRPRSHVSAGLTF